MDLQWTRAQRAGKRGWVNINSGEFLSDREFRDLMEVLQGGAWVGGDLNSMEWIVAGQDALVDLEEAQ